MISSSYAPLMFFQITGAGPTPPPPPPVSNWILETGFWNDFGVWDDFSNWMD